MDPFSPGLTRNERSTLTGHELGGILIDLRAQRRFRVEQLRELVASTAAALTDADEARLHVTGLLTIAAEAALDDIEGALRRLESGTYGTCTDCQQAVARRRLQMLPTARLCTLCHWRSEHGGLGHAAPATALTTMPSALTAGAAAVRS